MHIWPCVLNCAHLALWQCVTVLEACSMKMGNILLLWFEAFPWNEHQLMRRNPELIFCSLTGLTLNPYTKSVNPYTSNIMIINYLEWFGSVEDSQPQSRKEFLEQLKFFFSVIEKTPHILRYICVSPSEDWVLMFWTGVKSTQSKLKIISGRFFTSDLLTSWSMAEWLNV